MKRRLERETKKELHQYFNGDIHVHVNLCIMTVDIYFYDSTAYHTSVLLPPEIPFSKALAKGVAYWIIEEYMGVQWKHMDTMPEKYFQ